MSKERKSSGNSLLFIIIGIIIGAVAAVIVMRVLNSNLNKKETGAPSIETVVETETFDDSTPDDPVPTDEMSINVLKVNNKGIMMKEINVYLYELRDFYTSQYGEAPWMTELEDGTLLHVYAKEQLKEGLIRTEILNDKAADYDAELTEEEKNQCAEEAKAYIAELGQAICEDFALTEEGVRIKKEKEFLSTKVYNAALAEIAETAEDTSEAALAESFEALYGNWKLEYSVTEDPLWENIVIGSVG